MIIIIIIVIIIIIITMIIMIIIIIIIIIIIYIYIYIYIHIIISLWSTLMGPLQSSEFRQIGEKGAPWHFWEDKSRLPGVPQKVTVEKHEICVDLISADPICPFPSAAKEPRWGGGDAARVGGGWKEEVGECLGRF